MWTGVIGTLIGRYSLFLKERKRKKGNDTSNNAHKNRPLRQHYQKMCAFINHDQVEYLPAPWVIRHGQSLTAQMWLGSQTALWVVLLKHTAVTGVSVWWVESRYIHRHSWWSDCLLGGVRLNTHTAVVIRWNDCLLQKTNKQELGVPVYCLLIERRCKTMTTWCWFLKNLLF